MIEAAPWGDSDITNLRRNLWLGALLVGACQATAGLNFAVAQATPATFDGDRAYAYLKAICGLGARYSGSAGMAQQQAYLTKHFEQQGAKVSRQTFRVRHPLSGQPVEMVNLIVQWHPERRERILLCAHYDTRPYPDRDPVNPRGIFVGANDGGSGVAVLMELGQFMPQLPGPLGVDFVLFDGEELVFRETDRYFLGSEYFATEYARGALGGIRYRWGVLLDMVGDADLQLFQEKTSLSFRPVVPLVRSIWDTARKAGVKEFIPRARHQLRDDHIPLNQIARIPTCDIIDFDYPHWHTEQDTPENCSAESLGKVGTVMLQWLRSGP